MDAIRGFAGDDVERAVYYPQDDRYLLTKPEKRSALPIARRVRSAYARVRLSRRIPLGIRRRRRTTSRRSASSSTSSCAAPRVRSNPMLLG